MNSIKQINNKLNNKFTKGFKNIFSINLINLFIVLSLVIILCLVYLKYRKIELFVCTDPTDLINYPCTTQPQTTQPQTTQPQIPSINISDTGYIRKLLNSYITNMQNKVVYQNQLNIQENTIQTLAQKINDTLNPN